MLFYALIVSDLIWQFLFLGFAVISFAWIPFSKFGPQKCQMLLLSDGNHVFVYDVAMELIGTLCESGNEITNIVISPFKNSTDSFLVLGFQSDSSKVIIWDVNFSPDGKFNGIFVNSLTISAIASNDMIFPGFSFDFGETMSFLDTPLVFSSLNPTQKTVNMWVFDIIDKDSIPNNLKSSCGFSISTVGKIEFVKSSCFGKLAISHTDNQKQYIDIWDNEYSGLEMTLEHQIIVNSPAVCLDWFTSYDGQHLLGVALETKVFVYCKTHDDFGLGWTKVMENDVTDGEVKWISWLLDGSLFISTTEQSKLLNPWTTTVDGNRASYLFDLCSEKSGRLADYDPILLKQYLHWGKHDLVKYNLSILHRFVKFAVEREVSLSHIPIALWKIIKDREVRNI